MELPKNNFKKNLINGVHQLGIWNSISGNSVPELLATCGFDWVLIDTEHTVETVEIQSSLQSIAAYENVSAVEDQRKRSHFDKKNTRHGSSNVTSSLHSISSRSGRCCIICNIRSKWFERNGWNDPSNKIWVCKTYFKRASEEICLLVQVETTEAIEQIEAIALTPGIDGVFIGPADLSASMGYPGEIDHPKVVKAIMDAISKLKSLKMPSEYSLWISIVPTVIFRGTTFTAVGVDMVLLAESTRNLRKQFT